MGNHTAAAAETATAYIYLEAGVIFRGDKDAARADEGGGEVGENWRTTWRTAAGHLAQSWSGGFYWGEEEKRG